MLNLDWGLLLFLSVIVLYTSHSLLLRRFSITFPMVFMFFGALAGANGLGLIRFSLTTSDVETLTKVTLALLIFADSVNLDFDQVRADAQLPGRLLLVGLPLTVLLGGLTALAIFPEHGIGVALLLGAILAPTDSALGMLIVKNPRLPVRIRRALDVEGGLNDGITSPLVVLFIALSLENSTNLGDFWVLIALAEIAIGAAVGLILGWGGGWLFQNAVKMNWTSNVTRQLGNPAMALLVYFGASMLGGNGFVAVFIAGILFGFTTRQPLHEATEYTEITGILLTSFVWMRFGSTMVIPLFLDFNLRAFLYALLSLTGVRMIPVAIAMIGTHLRLDTKLVMGWLGPRGLASVVFMLIVYQVVQAAGLVAENLFAAAGWTILISVLLHAITDFPLANWYANRLKTATPDAPELVDLPELPTMHKAWFNL